MTKTRLFLATSIILNIFLLGVVSGGAAWLNLGHRMIFAGSLRVAGAELPAEQRRAFRAAIRQARADASETIAKAREAKARAAALLREPTVEENAVFAALEVARTADFAIRAAIEKKAVELAIGLSAEDRASFADAVDDRVRRAMQRAR